ncbi:hypothetical protein AMS68_003672 [Peltaster fructicola]|uniref:SPT2 chromatin protein n=1 Tax=Peltaster fructicola TaxID=286661 RepID=A0A6H0XU33_9PEZI|nr:hypothetical protein AMS68_003672 [Peltaster fructicola]
MSSFSAILSSLQDGKARESDNTPGGTGQSVTDALIQRSRTAASNKRKLGDQPAGARKAVKLSPKPSKQSLRPPPTIETESRSLVGVKTSKAPAARLQQNGTTGATIPPKAQLAAASTASAPAKRGFASLLAKANAAQEAIKAAGPNTIKHKATEVMKKKERERMKLAAKEEDKQMRRGNLNIGNAKLGTARLGGIDRNAEGKPVRRPKDDLSTIGTMRAKPDTKPALKHKRKEIRQDKYGGYASWSDLDAEDEEQDYESESDMEEAGFDDIMEEDRRAERFARQEDQRELELEERRRKEKLERKQKLMALNDSAAAAKKRY